MGAGVPSGATIASQPADVKFGIVSDAAGRWGNSPRRVAEPTANPCSLPDCMAPISAVPPSISICTRPPIRSPIACAGPPEKETIKSLIPVRR